MLRTAEHAPDARLKTKIFISYSRKDRAFADRLDTALSSRGFDVLIDRQTIYAFEDWWRRVQDLIGQSDTVIFILSPDAVKSEVALKEITYAASLNKRFAPIICRDVDASAVPEPLRRLNFIYFDSADHFDESTDQLAEALQTDIVWLRDHTRFGEAARAWVTAGRPNGLLLRTPALEMAEYWISSRPQNAPEPPDEVLTFISASRQAAFAAQRLKRRSTAAIFALLVGIIVGLVGWIKQDDIKEQWRWYTISISFRAKNFYPYVLSTEAERALKPSDIFRECAGDDGRDYCPKMLVLPPGEFTMGSPETEQGRRANEGPQHKVVIAAPVAVSMFEVTFQEWDACVEAGNCASNIGDMGWGRGNRPVINVSFDDAQRYVSWLTRMTGKPYRLLTEAEYEYATRAGTTTAYPWGDDIGKNKANCATCGSKWDWLGTAPVGSFVPNGFGLYDMVGNVWEWVADCSHGSYSKAPSDGSAWMSGDCNRHVVRGGSYNRPPEFLRSALRHRFTNDSRIDVLGFRVARTLDRQAGEKLGAGQ